MYFIKSPSVLLSYFDNLIVNVVIICLLLSTILFSIDIVYTDVVLMLIVPESWHCSIRVF